MKGAIGLGLLVGVVGSIFLPHVFALINGDNFSTFLSIINSLGTITIGLPGLLSAGFPGVVNPSFTADFNPNILALMNSPIDFMPILAAMLSWLVCGLLSGLFAQSVKKGVVSATIFIIVEILVFMLMRVITGADLIQHVILNGNGDWTVFVGGAIITPVGFS
ncbi:MAG: hypothetical protein GYA24_13575, partial [Candidatus Lokiarchaeota archaeon]|nr:hypothetical protein [Candidatus Lokiarchaeota archaeon]